MSDLASQSDAASDGDDAECIRRSHDLAAGVGNAMQKATAAVERCDTLLTISDHQSGIIAQLLNRLGLTAIDLDTFQTDNGPRVTSKRIGNVYRVQLR